MIREWGKGERGMAGELTSEGKANEMGERVSVWRQMRFSSPTNLEDALLVSILLPVPFSA